MDHPVESLGLNPTFWKLYSGFRPRGQYLSILGLNPDAQKSDSGFTPRDHYLAFKCHQASSSVNKCPQASSSAIKHHQVSKSIIKHHQVSSSIIKRHQASSSIILLVYCIVSICTRCDLTQKITWILNF